MRPSRTARASADGQVGVDGVDTGVAQDEIGGAGGGAGHEG